MPALAEKIRGKPGVEQVVAFGSTLHVSGRDAEKLRASVSPWMTGAFRWEKIESGLEDVFISLMETAKDNFSMIISNSIESKIHYSNLILIYYITI